MLVDKVWEWKAVYLHKKNQGMKVQSKYFRINNTLRMKALNKKSLSIHCKS